VVKPIHDPRLGQKIMLPLLDGIELLSVATAIRAEVQSAEVGWLPNFVANIVRGVIRR